MCDKANQVFVSDSLLLLDRKPLDHLSFVTELIECTCSTTMELSFRILVSTSTFPFAISNTDNILFRKRAVSAA